MTMPAIIDQARALRVSLRVEGSKLKIRGPRPAVERLLPIIRENKPQLLEALSQLIPESANSSLKSDPTCTDCLNVGRHRTCRRPVEAGLTSRFELVSAPEGYAKGCPVFKADRKPTGAPDPAEVSGHWLILRLPERLERWYSPPVTRAELELRYPGAAMIALPESETFGDIGHGLRQGRPDI